MSDAGATSDSRVLPRLARLQGSEDGRRWLRALLGLLKGIAQDWGLRLGEAFPDSTEALVVPASRPDASAAVLKIQFVGRENEHEADALSQWHGDGAVRLLEHDPDRHAMLLERCVPGSPLSQLEPNAALGVFVDLLPRLWKPADAPFRPLAEEAACWASDMESDWERLGRPFERRLVDAALDAIRSLAPTQGEAVLLHQDLHADNVLRAERQPWLAIDPKPLVGEREFGVAPIVRSSELGHGRRDVVHRLDRLTSDLGLDRERARLWTLAQTVAWSFEPGGHLERHIETARWLLTA